MAQYWKNRFLETTKDIFNNDEDYVKEIFRMYEGTINNLDGEILKVLNSMNEVSMAEAKKLLNKKEIKNFKKGLEEFKRASKNTLTPEIEKELDIVSKRVRISRLQAMQLSLKSNVSKLLNTEQKKLFAHLSNQFTSSYYKNLYELQRITSFTSFSELSEDFVNKTLNTSWAKDGLNFSDRIWKRKDKLIATLDTDLRQGLITGKSPNKITEVIADRLEVSKSNAKRLVMTESAAIHSGSKKIMYDRLGVKKYKIVATLDLRTSEICRDMDGKVFDAKDYEVGITAPPFHVYCRSTTVPYFEDDLQKEIEDTRMSRNLVTGKSERVPDMNYENWYNKYAVAYNDEKEFNNIVSILGIDMVGNLEKYKDIKYNNVEKYEQINRETNTIQMINNHSSFSEKFKEKVKNMYYEFRNHGYEFNMHGAERFIKHSNIGKYTEKEVLEVLNKDFNMRQISDDRPVKFYNNIQVIYTKDGLEIHNIIKRKADWNYKERLKKYERNKN